MFNLTILYVEDDADTRELFSSLLEEYCSKLYVAADGIEGVSIYKEQHIDIVLTDITMPNMNGLEMAETILGINKEAYIVILSAFNDSKYLQSAIDIGINSYLLKPINIDKLENTLGKITSDIEIKKQLESQKKEIENLNNMLHKQVKDEIEKNAEKDTLLLSQAKTSQMGELLRMIAHQWRQPLNAISSSSINIDLKNQMNLLTYNDIQEHTNFIEDQTQNMSNIINDFMDFFKPENDKNNFCINELLHKINYILDAQLKNKNISLEIVGENIQIYSYEKELANVLLNFLSNSVDAFNDVNVNKKIIKIIVLEKQDKSMEIIFKDNAGGIKEENIDKIFDVYFTTKEQGKGTGIGLYMTRRIVHEVLGGDISVSNVDNGVEFKILINKSSVVD